MKNSNIIISVVVVLLIAGGVTAYDIANPESNILNLQAFTPSEKTESSNVIESSDKSENSKGDGTGNSQSGYLSGSQSGSNVENSKAWKTIDTVEKAKKVAEDAIEEEGCYPGTPKWDKKQQMWIVKVYDENKEVVDTIGVERNGMTNRI
ncbi:MAG: hypothetical protein FWE58_00140 [Methanobrevibacter sp.]|nr:hypothetical protein [Methanobrevibacter sp.]